MRLISLEILGFGGLAQKRYELRRGLTVVLGPNEAGKSTLQQAILALLYGFYVRPRPTGLEKRLHARYRPWKAENYGGKLLLELDNGSRFFITRRFNLAEPETQIADAETGKDITPQFLQRRRGYVNFVDRVLGMSQQIFTSVACVPQGGFRAIGSKDAELINDALIRMVDSAGTSISARNVLERLTSQIRALGTDRSKSGPIYQMRYALEAARQALSDRQALSQSLAGDYQRVNDLKGEIADLLKKERGIELDLKRLEYQDLVSLLTRHEQLSSRRQEIQAELSETPAGQHIPPSQRDNVIKLMEERKILRQQRQNKHEELRLLSGELLNARRDLDNLPPPQDFWIISQLDEFAELSRLWLQNQERARQLGSAKNTLLASIESAGLTPEAAHRIADLSASNLQERQAAFDALENRRVELEAERAKIRANRRYLILGRIGVLSTLLAFFIVTFAAGSFLAIPEALHVGQDSLDLIKYFAFALAVMWVIAEATFSSLNRAKEEEIAEQEQEVEIEEMEMRSFLAPFGVGSLHALVEAHHRYLEATQLHHNLQARLETMQDVEQRLTGWLDTFGFSNISRENLARISEMIQQGKRLRDYIADLNRQIALIEKEMQSKNERMQEISRSLEGILQAANCWTGNLEEDAAKFEKLVDRAQAHDALMREWDKLNEIEREMLKGVSIGEIRDQVAQLEQELRGELAATNLPPHSTLQKLLEELRGQRHTLQLELAALKERIVERESQLPDLSEIEEEISRCEAELQRLVLHRQALELAFETLSEVAIEAHRDFAPRLAEFVGKHLQTITRGKYRELYVDPADFSIRLSHAEANSLIPLEFLSYGTREQVHLLLRAAIAQLFSSTAESVPLLLDDPLVHADMKRQEGAVEVVCDLTKSHQVIYFTKDQAVVDVLTSLRADYSLITLQQEEDFVPMRWAAGTAFHKR